MAKVKCPECKGEGRARDRWGTFLTFSKCEWCGGSGEVDVPDPQKPQTFEEAFDAVVRELRGKLYQAFDDVVKELRELIIRKQRDYGHENILTFGQFGVLVRANDKVARLKNLYEKGKQPANESVRDSWRDLANYAIIALMLMDGTFKLPLGEDANVDQAR